jgi:hypothetical protein
MKCYRVLLLCVLLSLVTGFSVVAQESENENPLLRLLSYVPATSKNRQFVTYGDLAVWHTSWNVPRIDSLDALDTLERDQSAYWMYIMPRQTTPPDVLGLQYLVSDDMRAAYGFDPFNVDRYLQAGQPPGMTSVIEYSFPQEQIADALTASGYTPESLDNGSTLYSILGDFEMDMTMETITTRVGQLGALNRIGVSDNQLVIGRATDVVTGAYAAHQGQIPSLADAPDFAAAVQGLGDSSLAEMGDLVGVIFVDGPQLADPLPYVPLNAPEEVIEELTEGMETQTALAPYTLAAFATFHSEDASHLVLALVFLPDTDAKAAAAVVAERMQSYTSLVTQQPLTDRWTFELATGTKVNNLPVALVSMRVDDPPPTPEDQEQVHAAVFDWMRMVLTRDTAFLIATLP